MKSHPSKEHMDRLMEAADLNIVRSIAEEAENDAVRCRLWHTLIGFNSLQKPASYAIGGKMDNLGPDVMERLAEAAHKVWMDGKLRDGWKYGQVTDKPKKIHSCLVPYAQLSEADKESDRDMVRGIPKILAAAGYKMVKAGEK